MYVSDTHCEIEHCYFGTFTLDKDFECLRYLTTVFLTYLFLQRYDLGSVEMMASHHVPSGLL